MTGAEPILIAGSVWLWESYGKDALAWLIQHLGKNAEDLKKAGWEKIDWARASKTYREKMQDLYGSMQIFGMNRPVPLDNVFTDVYVLDKPSAWRRHSIEQLQERAELHAHTDAPDERQSGDSIVRDEPRLFLLGQPGAGKTTFLKHLTMEAVKGRINAIPIFVSLKAWADSKLDLMPFLVGQFTICNFPNAQPFIETILTEGKALVLFDGLDEVSDANDQRQHTTQTIREFAQQYGKSRMVITCRTAATEYTFERFRYCELADFTEEQIAAFVERWFEHDQTKRDGFLAEYAKPENDRLQELAQRPLLLTMLCLTFDETMAFPRRKAELYEEAIEALLKKWDSSRSIQRDQFYKQLSLGHKRQLLTELAAESFSRGEFFMPRRELAARVMRFVSRLPPVDQSEDVDGEAILRAIEAQHGLLIERAQGIYSFSHLTFQEFFTARYIASHARETVFRSAVAEGFNPQWREVLHLTASMLDYITAEMFFRTWTQYLKALIQNDEGLTSLLQWVLGQTNSCDNTRKSLRAIILYIVCIDQAIQYNQELITLIKGGINLAHAFSRNLAHDVDIAHKFDLASDIELQRVHDLAHDLAQEMYNNRYHSSDIVFNIGIDLDRAIHSAQSFAHAFSEEIDHEYTNDRDITFTLAFAKNIDSACYYNDAREDAYDLSSICLFIYNHWRSYEHPNPSLALDSIPVEQWQLSEQQRELMGTYLAGTARLLECLELATVEDRQAILDQLLIVP